MTGLAVPADRRVGYGVRLRPERGEQDVRARPARPASARRSSPAAPRAAKRPPSRSSRINGCTSLSFWIRRAACCGRISTARGRRGDGRGRQRHADRQPGRRRRQPALHRQVAGGRRADAARAAAGRPHLSHRADRSAGGDDPEQRLPAARRPAARCAAAGDLDRQHPEGVAAGRRGCRTCPTSRSKPIVGMLPRLPATVPAVYRDEPSQGPDVRVIWPSPTDNSEVAHPVPTRSPARCRAPPSSPRRRSSSRCRSARRRRRAASRRRSPLSQVVLDKDTKGRDTAFIRNRDKFIRGPRGEQSRQLPLQLQGRLRPAAAGRHAAARRVGQPDDAAARPRQRPLPDRDRAGVREHDLRRSAARELPAEDELPDRHALRPVAEVGHVRRSRAVRRSRIRPRFRRAPVARATTRTCAPARSAPTTGTGATGFISGYPPDQFIMLEKGATYGTQDTQIWAPYYTLHKILAGPARQLRGGRQQEGARDRARHGRVDLHAAQGAAARDAHQHVEPLHRRRIRRHERSDGAPVPPHRRQAVPRVRQAVRQHQLLLRQRQPRARPGEERRHDPRQARQPAHPADHRRARDLPRHARRCRITRSPRTSGRWSTAATCTASAASPARAMPNNAECFTAQPNTLWENGFANGGQNETCATYNLLKLDRQLFMYDQTAKYMDHYERALYNHILASVAEDERRQHLPRAAQSRRAEAVRQRQHERLHLLQRHRAREQHEAAGHDLLPQRRQPGALRQPLRPLDAELDRAQDRRPADDRLPLRRHDEAGGEGERPVRHEGPRAAVGDAGLLRQDQRPGSEGRRPCRAAT